MKEILGIVGIVAIAALFIGGMTLKIMPLLEDLRVVEVKPGIECAIVSRIAHTSIDCWKVDKEITREEEIGDKYGPDIPYMQGSGPTYNFVDDPTEPGTIVITPIYNQYVPDIAGGERQVGIEKSIGRGKGLLIEGSHNMNEALYIRKNAISKAPRFSVMKHNAISVKCGEGTIDVDYDTGEATFNNGCAPSEASKELWRGIKPFFDLETRHGR